MHSLGPPQPSENLMRDILTVTLNPALDLATEVDRIVPDKKLRCAPAQLDPGGGGINVSRAIAILGAFTASDPSLSLAEIAGRTGLYKSTILRICGSLLRGQLLLPAFLRR